MEKKDQIQKRIRDQIVDSDFKGIVLSSVRSGKTRILLNSLLYHWEDSNNYPSVLVCYPNIDVKTSWINECNKIGYEGDIIFCTFASLHKIADNKWDYVIFDE